jgi:hypothetical protein
VPPTRTAKPGYRTQLRHAVVGLTPVRRASSVVETNGTWFSLAGAEFCVFFEMFNGKPEDILLAKAKYLNCLEKPAPHVLLFRAKLQDAR